MPWKILATILVMSPVSPAFAYLDPASGGALISALIGVAVGVSLFFKGLWFKILRLARRLFGVDSRALHDAESGDNKKTVPEEDAASDGSDGTKK